MVSDVTTPIPVNFEPIIWARLLEAQFGAHQQEMTPEVARFFVSMGFAEKDRERINFLADQSQAGHLTAEEEAEFDGYLHVGNLLTLMKAKARTILGVPPPANQVS